MSTQPIDRLTPDNAALMLVDHQTGLADGVTDQSIPEFRTAVTALAATAKLLKLPTIITTSAADGPNGPVLPEIPRITKEMSMKTVLLIGGTGNLGGLIGRELLKRGARLRLLVRPGSRSKVPADLAQAAEIVEDEPAAFQGVFSVVSAVQGGPETIVDAQLRFLRAAGQAGVRRFIASDYSMNLFGVPEGDNVSSDHRDAVK